MEELVESIVQVGRIILANILRAFQIKVDLASERTKKIDSLRMSLVGEVLIVDRADNVTSFYPRESRTCN